MCKLANSWKVDVSGGGSGLGETVSQVIRIWTVFLIIRWRVERVCGSEWWCVAGCGKVSSVEVKIVLIRGNVYLDFPIRRFEFVYLLTQKVEGCVSLSLLFFFF